MKSSLLTILTAAFAAREVTGHAIFQQLWVDGTDYGSTCNRLPTSNSPVTNVGSRDFVCNAGTRGVSGKCPVKAGGTVTVEMHQVSSLPSCSWFSSFFLFPSKVPFQNPHQDHTRTVQFPSQPNATITTVNIL